MICKRVAFFTLLAVVAQVNPAHAITATLESAPLTPNGPSDGLYTSVAGVTTINFNSKPVQGAQSYTDTSGPVNVTYTQDSNGLLIRNSTQTEAGYAPTDASNNKDTSNFLITGSYYDPGNTGFSTTGNTQSGIAVNHGPVTITFSQAIKYYGLYWGLINASNTIKFYDANNNQLPISNTAGGNVITGQDLKNQNSSLVIDTNGGNSRYVDFVAGTNEAFSKVVLDDTGTGAHNGFETDNHSYKVPSPDQTIGILALGLIGAWNLSKHNRKTKQKQLALK